MLSVMQLAEPCDPDQLAAVRLHAPAVAAVCAGGAAITPVGDEAAAARGAALRPPRPPDLDVCPGRRDQSLRGAEELAPPLLPEHPTVS